VPLPIEHGLNVTIGPAARRADAGGAQRGHKSFAKTLSVGKTPIKAGMSTEKRRLNFRYICYYQRDTEIVWLFCSTVRGMIYSPSHSANPCRARCVLSEAPEVR